MCFIKGFMVYDENCDCADCKDETEYRNHIYALDCQAEQEVCFCGVQAVDWYKDKDIDSNEIEVIYVCEGCYEKKWKTPYLGKYITDADFDIE